MYWNTKSCRFSSHGATPWKELVHRSNNGLTSKHRIGLVVNAGPSLGYGHAVRCQRIAQVFRGEAAIFPISETCRRFFEAVGFGASIMDLKTEKFPPVMAVSYTH